MICSKTHLNQILNSMLRGWIKFELIEEQRIKVKSLTKSVYENKIVSNTRRGYSQKTW